MAPLWFLQVELIGYAATNNELFLIYEYSQKGTLKNHLHDPQSKGNILLDALCLCMRFIGYFLLDNIFLSILSTVLGEGSIIFGSCSFRCAKYVLTCFSWDQSVWVFDDVQILLLGHTSLSWIMRVQIALDAARGLEYIHEHAKNHYVHRDIKTNNILLDGSFRAKVFFVFWLS